MADYILHNGGRFQGCTVLELGAGVGLVSIVGALHARHIFCTGAIYFFVSIECHVLNKQKVLSYGINRPDSTALYNVPVSVVENAPEKL